MHQSVQSGSIAGCLGLCGADRMRHHPLSLLLALILASMSARPAAPSQEPATAPAAVATAGPREVVRFYPLSTDEPDLAAASGALDTQGRSRSATR